MLAGYTLPLPAVAVDVHRDRPVDADVIVPQVSISDDCPVVIVVHDDLPVGSKMVAGVDDSSFAGKGRRGTARQQGKSCDPGTRFHGVLLKVGPVPPVVLGYMPISFAIGSDSCFTGIKTVECPRSGFESRYAFLTGLSRFGGTWMDSEEGDYGVFIPQRGVSKLLGAALQYVA